MRFNEQLINLPHLDQVIDRSPLTINPDSDVVDAIILMNQEQSKSLALTGDRSLFLTPTSHPQVESFVLVVEARQLLGIFSATDVLRLIALGMDIKGVKVAQVMKSPAVTMIYEDGENILTAWSLLQQHRTHYLPILDTAGLLLGVIKETRLLAALDIMKIKALVATLEQNVPPPSNKFPSAHQQIEFIGAQTRNNLRQLEEEQSTELMQFNQEFQQTLEELQVVEEELRQQNEQLLIAHEIAELERQRYRDLFEFAPDGYLVTNTSGIIEEANQAASRLLSIPQQHLIGLPLALFIAPPENLTFASQLRNWQKLQNWEISIQPRQGKAFPASVRVAPVCDAQGEQSGWRWLLCDISQRKQIESALREATDDLEHRIGERTAQLLITNQRLQQEIIERQRVEEALRQSEQLYRQLVECQSELILRADLQGRLIFANQAFCQTFGLKLEEFRGQSVWQFAHPDDLSAILNSIATLANSSCQLSNGEIRAITVNGVRWLQWNVAKIEDETGKVVEIQAVGRDITEQKQTAEALQKSEEKFRHFAENTNVVMWIDDPNTNHNIYVNPAYEKIWGRSCQSLQDKPDSWVEAIHPEDRDRVLSTLEQLKQGQSTDVEYRIIRPDGTLRWIWDRGFVMPGEQEGVHLCGGIAEDITERKQIEESLRESETRLTLALEAGQMGIWDWNLLTGEAVWSDNMPPLYGLPYGSISIGHEEFINLIHPEDRELVLSAEANSMTQGYPHTQEYRVIWPDGSVHWLLAKGQTYYDQDNRAIRMIGVTRDISERQAALHERQLVEKALRESEERYRSVVAALREGIILADAQGNIITCNASAEKILGISSAEIIGHNLYHSDWQTIYEDGSPFHKENYPGIVTLQTGQPCSNVVMGIYLANGKLTWVSMNSQPLFRENESQHYAVVVSFTDMSERKQAEEKILEQAALLDIATNAIFVQDFRNQILFWNKGAERLYGWQSLEVINKSPREIFYSKSIPKLETTALEKVMESGTWQGELNKLNKSGEEIIVESHWTLVRDDAGQPKSILTVETDITEKKQLQAQFLRTQRLESIGTLAGGIAHDLNNILTPILGSAQLLRGKFANDLKRHQQLLPLIEENAKRGADLVKQVLSFARGFKGERTEIQVRHLIREIIQIAKQTFPKSIKFTTEIIDDLWVVSGDSTQLHQVLMNLVVNSRDAMPQGGNLKITAENLYIDEAYTQMHLEAKVGNYIVITVADTGIGMPPEILDRIFEPFFTTKEVGAGTGLGLSTVLGIMKSHDGFVTVSSEVGRGTEFKLFLPAVKAKQVENTDTIEILHGKGEVILIVDDEAQVREVTKIILENHHYQILTASNGIEAIALYAQYRQQISAILMDMMMPEMDGLTAIRTLQKINPQIRIIACTGLNTNNDLPVQTVLYKPYTAKELLRNLHQILRCVSG